MNKNLAEKMRKAVGELKGRLGKSDSGFSKEDSEKVLAALERVVFEIGGINRCEAKNDYDRGADAAREGILYALEDRLT